MRVLEMLLVTAFRRVQCGNGNGTETFHFIDTDREETFTEQKGDKRELIVQVWYPAAASGGAGHYNFTDLQLYSPLIGLTGMTRGINGTRGAEIVNRYLLKFFNQHLRGTESKLLAGPNVDFPEVKYPNLVYQGE